MPRYIRVWISNSFHPLQGDLKLVSGLRLLVSRPYVEGFQNPYSHLSVHMGDLLRPIEFINTRTFTWEMASVNFTLYLTCSVFCLLAPSLTFSRRNTQSLQLFLLHSINDNGGEETQEEPLGVADPRCLDSLSERSLSFKSSLKQQRHQRWPLDVDSARISPHCSSSIPFS